MSRDLESCAALGAALRAAGGFLNAHGERKTWSELAEQFMRLNEGKSVAPRKGAVRIYHGENGLLRVYEACEAYALGAGPDPEGRIKRFKEAVRAGCLA